MCLGRLPAKNRTEMKSAELAVDTSALLVTILIGYLSNPDPIKVSPIYTSITMCVGM